MLVLSTVGRESLHAEAVEGASEEAVSDHEGEDQPAGRSQQGHLGSQQVGEFVSGAAETQQDPEGSSSSALLSQPWEAAFLEQLDMELLLC